jgi:hypothetical protein
MLYNKQILESHNKAAWKSVKKGNRQLFYRRSYPSVKINDNVIMNPELIAHCINTYLTITGRTNK